MARPPKPKPIRFEKVGVISRPNIPGEGSIIPRLQQKDECIQAIGFTANISSGDEEES